MFQRDIDEVAGVMTRNWEICIHLRINWNGIAGQNSQGEYERKKIQA